MASHTNDDCSSCHTQEAAEWDASLHHASFTDRDFQASFASEPLAFCFGCHAPLAKERNDHRGAALGVGCTACHAVASGHGRENTIAKTTDCASCHEFAFPPNNRGRGNVALMQSTVTEHRQSAFADRNCAACHLPRKADGHRDHRFDVTRNEALLRSALTLRSERRKDGAIEVILTTNNVGHAMPTGDLFRRLRVAIHARGADGSLVDEREILLNRDFDFERSGSRGEVEKADARIRGERRLTIEGGAIASAKVIEIDVHYERVAQTSAHADRVFSSIIIAEAELAQKSP